jgi:hypothetical protein
MTLGHGDTEFPEDVLGLIFVQFHRIQPLFHSDLLGSFIAFSAFLVKLAEKQTCGKGRIPRHITGSSTIQACAGSQIRISKSEIRNKFKTPRLQCSKQKTRGLQFWSFEFGSLDIVSDFVLWILDFQGLRTFRKNNWKKLKRPLDRGFESKKAPSLLERVPSVRLLG